MALPPTVRKLLKPLFKPAVDVLRDVGYLWRTTYLQHLPNLLCLKCLPRYLSQYRSFQKLGGKITHRYPIISDYSDQAGSASGDYFHQDLLVASFIHKAAPVRHVDVGSRIDGFVAHVAAFREIEVMDIRDLKNTGHSNISFVKADLMDMSNVQESISDSISCLHAIEHFGLGRYGDSLDPNGHIKGFNNILKMLKPEGVLYISFPIGRANAIHFNAHRVFHPHDIFTWANDRKCVHLLRFDFVDDEGDLHQNVDLKTADVKVNGGCGIYTFKKASF